VSLDPTRTRTVRDVPERPPRRDGVAGREGDGVAGLPERDGVVLEARGLRVERAGRALVAVDHLSLRAAETHVLLGPNGAGKSTLLGALNGLLEATGELRFAGRPVATVADRLALRRRTAAVFQEPYLLATTVRGNVEAGLRLRGGLPRHEAARRAAAALDLLGIGHLSERRRDGLSGGEAQRVSIARALAVDPAVLFLDEPMASLDPPTRRGLLADLVAIFADRSTAVVWVTHDKEEALAVADAVTFLSGGVVVQTGSCADVFNRPATVEVAEYLGAEAWLEGEVVQDDVVGRFVLANGSSIACGEAPPGPALACVHPEDVAVFRSPPASGSTSLRNVVEGTVGEVIESGRLRRVRIACRGFTVVALVTRSACDELALTVGATVYAAFKATAVQVIPRSSRSYEEGEHDGEV